MPKEKTGNYRYSWLHETDNKTKVTIDQNNQRQIFFSKLKKTNASEQIPVIHTPNTIKNAREFVSYGKLYDPIASVKSIKANSIKLKL